MTDRPLAESVRSQLVCGLSLFVPAITAHVLVFVNNFGYVAHYFGTVMLVAYITATAAAIAWPHVISVLGASTHTRATSWALSVFIGWITVEENIHASKTWHAPEGTSQVLAAFGLPEVQAKGIAVAMMVVVSFLVVEMLTHFLHTGYHLSHDAHCKLRAHKQHTHQ